MWLLLTSLGARLLLAGGLLLAAVHVSSSITAYAQQRPMEKVVVFTPGPEPTADVASLQREGALRPVPPPLPVSPDAGSDDAVIRTASDTVVVAPESAASESVVSAVQPSKSVPLGPDAPTLAAPKQVRSVGGARVGSTASLPRVQNRVMTQRVPNVVLLPNQTQQPVWGRPNRGTQARAALPEEYDVPTYGQRRVRALDGSGPTVVDLGVARHSYAADSDGGRRVGGLYRLTERVPELTKGTRSDAVRQLQVELVRAGISLEIDGVYGDQTVDAIRTLQRRMNAAGFALRVDGIYGPMTHAAWLRYRMMRGGHRAR